MTAVILAAGLSRRFQGKKLLMKIDGKPMVIHVADLVSAMGFEQKVFVYSDEEVFNAVQENCERASDFTFIYNKRAEEGLSTSIRVALNSNVSDGIIFFVGDQPFINETTVNRLIEAFYQKKGSIIVPVYGGSRGNPVIFSKRWADRLKNLKGDMGGRLIIRENQDEVWEVQIEDSRIGRDIDTKEEYYACHGERNSG